MELSLFYRGKLKSNADAEKKQAIRNEFHKQLKELWKLSPFIPEPESFCKDIGGIKFLPLVVEGRREVAELDITLLRPAPPGFIVGEGGDIDNRIKTLLDSLRMPRNEGEFPEKATEKAAEITGDGPFYCLLEDDKLITKLSVSTGRLLVSEAGRSDVLLLINVKVKTLGTEFGHMMIRVIPS